MPNSNLAYVYRYNIYVYSFNLAAIMHYIIFICHFVHVERYYSISTRPQIAPQAISFIGGLNLPV